MNHTYLEAISGDCGTNAMSKKADKIYIEPKYKEFVQLFMIAQADWLTEVCFADMKNLTKELGKARENFYIAADHLEMVGIFNNKWQFRTEWRLITEYEVDEYNAKITELEKEITELEKETA